MNIPLVVSEAMFAHAHVSREELHEALRWLCPRWLRGPFREAWRPENPTRYADYVVTEWLIHYRAPLGTFAFRVDVPGQQAKHYFTRWPDGTLIDLTAEQFDQWELVDYAAAKKASMPDVPSSRAGLLETFIRLPKK